MDTTKLVIDRLINDKINNVFMYNDPFNIARLASTVCAMPVYENTVKARLDEIAKDIKQVEYLCELPKCEQRSTEWHDMRNGLITASDCAQCIGKGKFGTQNDFILKKVRPDLAPPFNASAAPLTWGIKYEDAAKMIYCQRNNIRVYDFGLLKHPSKPFIGASPDGITEQGVMLEIKCPWRRKIKFGEVPTQYMLQMQVQLDVCNLNHCDYLEVGFKQYDDETAFLADKFLTNESSLNALGNEKGIIIENADGSFIHPPYFKKLADLLEWRNTQIAASPTTLTATYWQLDIFHLQRVTRDLEILASLYSNMKPVWDRVLNYRNNPDLFNKEILNNNGCFLDSD